MKQFLRLLLVAIIFPTGAPWASALITGGSSNEPLHDPGWPAGAAMVFNHPGRVAHWEGPPFGGGQVTFRNVPPGKYILRGHPNPTTEVEVTDPIEVDLRGDEVKSIDFRAK